MKAYEEILAGKKVSNKSVNLTYLCPRYDDDYGGAPEAGDHLPVSVSSAPETGDQQSGKKQ